MKIPLDVARLARPAALLLLLLLLGAAAALPAIAQPPEDRPPVLPDVLSEPPPQDVEEGRPPEPPPPEPPPPVGEPVGTAPALFPDEGPPTVRGIEIRSDVPLDAIDQLRSLVALEVGEPLAEARVQRTVTNLYASGLTSRVAVLTEPVPGGVRAVVSLWGTTVVEEVRVEGDFGVFDREDLEAELTLTEGEALIESRVLRDDFRLEEMLAERGYFQASVLPDFIPDEPRKRVKVIYRVDPGPRAVVEEIRFRGDPRPFTPEELRSALRSEVGKPFSRDRVENDSERLERWLVERKYREAQVGDPIVDVDRGEGAVGVTYPIDIGPKVLFEVEGGDLSKLKKKGLLPFLGDEGFDEALLLQAEERIRSYYQSQGFYRARVTTREEVTGEAKVITFEVDRGLTYELVEIRFAGNEAVSDDRLEELVESTTGGFLGIFGLGGGELVDEELEADLDNIRSFYALEGYLGTEVGPARIDVREREIYVTIPIEEGARRTVSSLELEGVEDLDASRLRRGLPLEAGGPFHPRLLDRALGALRATYAEEGFPDAQVSADLDWNEARTEVAVTFEVFEGPRQTVDQVIVRGNTKTGGDVVRRALEIEPGDPVSETRLLELERRLYRLGVFSRVDVRLTPPELGATTRDIVVRVEEGRVKTLTYGAGYDSDDGVRGLVGFSNRNVGGRLDVFRADLQASREIVSSGDDEIRFRRARVLFSQPFIEALPVSMLYEAFRFEEEREAFEVVRWVGRIEAQRSLFGRGAVSLAYDYRLLALEELDDVFFEPPPKEDDDVPEEEFEDPPPVLREGVLSPLEEGELESWVSSVIGAAVFDRQDDPVDPTSGWRSSLQLQLAFPALEAEAEFFKVFLQQTAFYPLRERHVLAGSLRLGGIEPMGDIGDSGARDLRFLRSVPLDERFFAGGRTTHRAYERFGLGRVGETLLVDLEEDGEGIEELAAIGGNGLALVNLEYRFPIFSVVGGVLFYDVGNVWSDWRDVDFGELKDGVGVGVRYLSPIGPLRVDVGWKLDRVEGEDEFEVHFVLGNPF